LSTFFIVNSVKSNKLSFISFTWVTFSPICL
jgi:hypothetical protein